jgi:hypothetical protein
MTINDRGDESNATNPLRAFLRRIAQIVAEDLSRPEKAAVPIGPSGVAQPPHTECQEPRGPDQSSK